MHSPSLAALSKLHSFRSSPNHPMKRTSLLFAAFGLTAATAVAQSAFLPSEGELVATPGYLYSTYDKFWAGKTEVSVLKDNNASFDQHNGFVAFEYGLTPRIALDATVGYVYATTGHFTGFGRTSTDGLADTSFGLRYLLVDGATKTDSWIPNVAVRAGGIAEGSYNVQYSAPLNAGDGASGVEGSLIATKVYSKLGTGYFAEIGFRHRAELVQDDIFGSVGIFQEFSRIGLKGFSISVAYRQTEALSGGDIGGPGFGSTYGFPQVREISKAAEVGVAYTDAGRRSYQFTFAQKFDGRNTGEGSLFLFSISLPLQLK